MTLSHNETECPARFPDPGAAGGFARGWAPLRQAGASLVDQLAEYIAAQIRNHGLRSGMRLPSVRAMAQDAGLSRHTVVQAYDKLAAQGLIQPRKGSGFYVSPPSTFMAPPWAVHPETGPDGAFDTAFLLRSMFRNDGTQSMAGNAGLLPADWLDQDMVGAAVRTVGRTLGSGVLGYGDPQGHRGLRQRLATLLQNQDIPAHPDDNLMTVAGVTQGLDLVARALLRPGDAVLVEDPGWFLIFGRLAVHGVRVVGVPRLADGPDTRALEHLAQAHAPKLFILNTAVHNPTGHTLSAGVAHEVLRIAERHDFLLAEDDTYADFHPGMPLRLATLDRLNRVILVGGFSKTLAASLRVGYIAASAPLVRRLTDAKLLSGLTTPELGEQVVNHVLAEGKYRRHIQRLRARVDQARNQCMGLLAELGCVQQHEPCAGMFMWVDTGVDTEALARRAAARGVLFAPGVLFSPEQRPSSWMRLPVSMIDHPRSWEILRALLEEARRGR
ncbi:PLP-dependent aminotransferase family protein [Alcaligenaceae bacterium]|nr:PLP-dependent aminotransferase family protein [Alcaligenaceae bacterium]